MKSRLLCLLLPTLHYNTHHFYGFGMVCLWFEVKGIACQCFAFLKHSSSLPTLTFPVSWWAEVGNAQILLQERRFGCLLLSAANYNQEICNLFAFWRIRLQAAASWQKWSTVFSLNALSGRNSF